MNLFDYLSTEEKARQSAGWITPGAIFYLSCAFVQKACTDKYLLLGAVEPECLMFMINTDPRHVTIQTQVKLLQVNYEGSITSDCFINCNAVITEFTVNGVQQQVIDDGTRYRGRVTVADQREVVAAVKFAKDISKVHQDMIYAALDEAA